MAMIVVILDGPSAKIRGIVRNALLEPRPNLFVGSLDLKRIKALVAMLEETKTNGIICAQSAKSPFGMRLKVIGDVAGRQVVDVDGLQLVKRQEKSKG